MIAVSDGQVRTHPSVPILSSSFASDVLFSAYMASVVVTAHMQIYATSGVTMLWFRYFHEQFPAYGHSGTGPRYLGFAVALALAVVLLFLSRYLRRWSLEGSLHTIRGSFVICVLPFVYLYMNQGGSTLLIVEALVLIAGLILYVRHNQSKSTNLVLGALGIHFALWTLANWDLNGLYFVLMWPTWDWVLHTSRNAPLIFHSFTGLVLMAIWVTRTSATARPFSASA